MLFELDRVEVVDEYTVRFVLKESFAPFLSVIAQKGMPQTEVIAEVWQPGWRKPG